MSRLHKAVLGLPQGTLGQLVFRIRRGIAYISTRPIPFMPGILPADYARRGRFGMACRFSKLVNSIPQLRALWEPLSQDLSPYNLIAQENYDHVTNLVVNNTAVITPFGGLGLHITAAVLTNLELQIEIDALLTDKIDPLVETRARIVSVMYLSGPIDPATPSEAFLPIVTAAQAFDVQAPTIFNIPMDSQDTDLYDLYANHKLFYALLIEDAAGKVYHFSKTCNA